MRHYSLDEYESKLKTDLKLFGELFTQYLTESDLPHFKNMLIDVYNLGKELHEETNVAPQLANISLRTKRKLESLTENEIKEILYTSFRDKVSKDFVEPFENGRLLTLHENDVSQIIKVLVKSDSDLDPEISKKYGIFEKIIGNVLKEVVLPNDSILNMKSYAESVNPSYYSVFDRNIKTVKSEFNEAIEKLIRNFALKMFKCGIQVGSGEEKSSINFDSYKGISQLISEKDTLDETLDKIKIEKPVLDDSEIDDIVKD